MVVQFVLRSTLFSSCVAIGNMIIHAQKAIAGSPERARVAGEALLATLKTFSSIQLPQSSGSRVITVTRGCGTTFTLIRRCRELIAVSNLLLFALMSLKLLEHLFAFPLLV